MTPSDSAALSTSSIPSSKFAPFAIRRSASIIFATCFAEAWKSCGSDPGGIIISTSKLSPTILVTTSPRILVVTTINGFSSGDDISAELSSLQPVSANEITAIKAVRVKNNFLIEF